MKITFEPDGVIVEELIKGDTLVFHRAYSEVEVWFKNPRPDVVRVENPFLVIESGLISQKVHNRYLKSGKEGET